MRRNICMNVEELRKCSTLGSWETKQKHMLQVSFHIIKHLLANLSIGCHDWEYPCNYDKGEMENNDAQEDVTQENVVQQPKEIKPTTGIKFYSFDVVCKFYTQFGDNYGFDVKILNPHRGSIIS